MITGNPNIRVEATDVRDNHCFRVTFNARPGADAVERGGIEIMLHATDLVDLIHKASLALCDWQAQGTEYLLRRIHDALAEGHDPL